MEVLFATTNPAKIKRYKEKLEDYLQDKKYIENIDVLYYQFLETYKGV